MDKRMKASSADTQKKGSLKTKMTMGVLLLTRARSRHVGGEFALVHGMVVGPAWLHHTGASDQGTGLASSCVDNGRKSGLTHK